MGGMGHSGGMSSMGRSGTGRVGTGPTGFARMSPGVSRAAVGNPSSFARVGVAHPRIALRNHRHHNRFFVFAGGYPYGYYNYYDGCYERILTRWGWRLTYVCGDDY